MYNFLTNVFEYFAYSATFFLLGCWAISYGVKNGLMLFAMEFLPIYLELLKQENNTEVDTVETVLDAQDAGEISSEEAVEILRRMRGEK